MRRDLRSVFQVIFLLSVVIILVRFFPFVAQVGEAAALGIRQFWWGILILSLCGWLIWVMGKRNAG